MAFTTDTAHKALTYKLHRVADKLPTVGGVTPYTLFTDAPESRLHLFSKNIVEMTLNVDQGHWHVSLCISGA